MMPTQVLAHPAVSSAPSLQAIFGNASAAWSRLKHSNFQQPARSPLAYL